MLYPARALNSESWQKNGDTGICKRKATEVGKGPELVSQKKGNLDTRKQPDRLNECCVNGVQPPTGRCYLQKGYFLLRVFLTSSTVGWLKGLPPLWQ